MYKILIYIYILIISNNIFADQIHVYAVGDILLGDQAQKKLDQYGNDYPFLQLRPLFKNVDILIGNLEAPLTTTNVPLSAEKTYIYKSSPKTIEALKNFGFHTFCLANNHILDYGVQGLRDTISHLESVKIQHFGAGSYNEAIQGNVFYIKNTKIGLLGFMESYRDYREKYNYFAQKDRPGVAKMGKKMVQKAIKQMRPKVDILIVSFHWGRNYRGVTARQKKWGKRAVKYGADAIIGHHPHIVQGMEIYQGVPIIYSLGNFTFGTPGRFRQVSPYERYGWVIDIVIDSKKIDYIDFTPIATDNQQIDFQPRPASPKILPAIISHVNKNFATKLQIQGSIARLQVATTK